MELPRVLETISLSPPAMATAPFPLSGLDTDGNVHHVAFRTLRFFRPPDPSLLLAVLPRAFVAALGLFPQVAGCLRDGHVVSGAYAVPMVLAACDLSVAQVDTDSAGSDLLDRLAPGDGEGSALLALQATRFACGGVALGMRLAHALCDGAGATRFLASAARFAQGLDPGLAPVWRRRELLGPRRPPQVVKPFGHVLAPSGTTAARVGHQHYQLARVCFHVSEARVEALRARLADEAALKLTTFEVLAAFIWRAK